MERKDGKSTTVNKTDNTTGINKQGNMAEKREIQRCLDGCKQYNQNITFQNNERKFY